MLPALATLDILRKTLPLPVARTRPAIPGDAVLPAGYETALVPDLPMPAKADTAAD